MMIGETQKHLTQAKLETLYGSSNVSITFNDIEGNFIYANESWCSLTGYSVEELQKLNFKHLSFEEDLLNELPLVEELQKKIKKNYRIEKRVLCKDKRTLWIDIFVSLIEDSHQGDIFIGVAVDITQHKKAYFELQEQKKFLDDLIENAGSSISIKDIKGHYTFVNKEFQDNTGFEKSDILFKKDGDIFNEFISQQFIQNDTKVLSLQTKQNFEEILITQKNDFIEKFFLTTKFPLFNFDGVINGLCSISTDITDLKNIEDKLKHKEFKLQHLLDEMPVGIARISKEQEIIYTNRKLEMMIGYSKKDIHTLDIWWEKGFPDLQYRKMVIANWKKSLKESIKHYGDIYPMEYQVQCKNQQLKNIEISGIVFEDEILVTFVDLTERKHYEESLKKAKKDADNANRSKTLFLANMSHEIRTPMNAILGLTDLLLDITTQSKQIEYLEKIQNSSKSLLQILNDILDHSKIEAHKIDILKEEFPLYESFDTIINLFLPTIEQKGLDFHFQIDKNIPKYVIGDELRFSQVLSNLLSNAIKFTHQGSILLKVEKVSQNKQQTTLKISVEDTGIGIESSNIEKLFSEFNQIDDTITKRYGGTGLGLSISKNLLTLMGGTIGVKSEFQKGSCFYFTIEFQVANKKQSLKKRQKKLNQYSIFEIDLSGKNILIVEDNEYNQEVMKGLLQKYHATTHLSFNGKEALEIIDKEPIDLIFMDLHMPIMDGLETTIEIRRLSGEKSKIPIIAMSAAVTQNDRELCIISGMDDFVPKPIERQVVLHKIKSLLNIMNKEATSTPTISYQTTLIEKFDIDEIEAKHYLHIFLESSQKFLDQCDSYLQTENITKLKEIVHNIKSSIGSLDNNSLYHLIKTIYTELQNGQIPKESLQQLTLQIKDLRSQISKEILV